MDDLDREIAGLLGTPQPCGTCKKTTADVRFVADPFLLELHEEVAMDWYCDRCFGKRLEDI
ncbi:hypothetical protein AB0F91_39805 [Amycolatopsis sp. NPDC023774]|uniref:hypothetical protein n=1 Tax=Amycolatopsis sp. NPDC023774 TaxID=3155015 RepID=UPI003409CFD9